MDLVNKGYYNGKKIDRSDGFVVQMGDSASCGSECKEGLLCCTHLVPCLLPITCYLLPVLDIYSIHVCMCVCVCVLAGEIHGYVENGVERKIPLEISLKVDLA